jgi:hypothetical protein
VPTCKESTQVTLSGSEEAGDILVYDGGEDDFRDVPADEIDFTGRTVDFDMFDVDLIGDTTDGHSLFVRRHASEADSYIRFYSDEFSQGILHATGNVRLDSDTDIINSANSFYIGMWTSNEPTFQHFGMVGAAAKYVQWQLPDTSDKYELTREDETILGVDIQMPLEVTQLITTGTITGAVDVVVTTDTTLSPDATALRGTMHISNNASGTDYTLPDISDSGGVGLSACFYDMNGNGVVVLDPAAGDLIILDGVALSAANQIDSAGDAGDFICILSVDTFKWITLGRSGTWIDGDA